MGGETRLPGWIANALGQLGDVGYHCRVFERMGAIELSGTCPVRGAPQHLYRARWQVRLEVDRIV
jgi:hypothetical protein